MWKPLWAKVARGLRIEARAGTILVVIEGEGKERKGMGMGIYWWGTWSLGERHYGGWGVWDGVDLACFFYDGVVLLLSLHARRCSFVKVPH